MTMVQHLITADAPALRPVLAVDLDGTLLRTDMAHERFWSALGRDGKAPLRAIKAAFAGPAALKRHLAQSAQIDPASLPYDGDILARIVEWRAAGGRTALVTAADQGLADRIAAHLDLFDEVIGSDGTLDLKGETRARTLVKRFGRGGFTYMGDSAADTPVWAEAHSAITVNATPRLRTLAETAGEAEHLTTRQRSIAPYIRALRPHQWMKNLLCFVPMLAAHEFGPATILASLLCFIAFSLTASSVYCLNDMLDLANDRAHPRKRLRPFASGAVPLAHGAAMAAGLLTVGAIIGLILGPVYMTALAGYFVATTLYSLHLKKQVVLDICVLAGLYTMRIIAGAFATGIPLSQWLLAFSIFFFFSLAAVKRQAELVDMAARDKLEAAGRGYRADDLPIVAMAGLAAGFVSVLVMALYLDSPEVAAVYSEPSALWGICAVLLFWITRMVMKAHRGQMDDDPLVFAARDHASQLCLLAVAGFGIGASVL